MLQSRSPATLDAWGTARHILVDSNSIDPLDLADPQAFVPTPNVPSALLSHRPSRLERARSHKEQGNVIFKKALDYRGAAREYKRALHCMRRITTETRDNLERELRIPCYLNLAACDLELMDHAAAERHASKVLRMDPDNVKALFRRAAARKYAARNLHGALADLQRAAVLAPADMAVKKALATLQNDIKRAKEAELLAAQRMFGGA